MNIPAALAALVKDRAGHRCEYCGMSQSLQGATFHLEHIIPLTCGGVTAAENLALACPSCNLHKSDRSHALDPDTHERVALFHPRRQRWSDEFAWEGTSLVGLTSSGRATAHVLDLNHPRRLRVREAEALFDLFPPRT
jgi:hypothetical protein